MLDDVCRCGTTVKDRATHQAEVLAAAGLIPTSTEWGVRTSLGVSQTLSGEQAARDFSKGGSPARVVVSRAVTDWKDAT
ncbi:hypothetical protein [Oerskovia enterophila]|uniref:hypothetical protein n=1 Tax=Oerskovia enterophila TaxID=43678 RepID=UPI003391F746